jgi:V/A-type H+-transporting ATPase subunit I
MVALPIFAAMIIGDAGYGLIFLALPLLLYRRMLRAAGRAKTHLVLVVGAGTVAWGVLTANYFGVTPADLLAWGGFASVEAMRSGSGLVAAVGRAMVAAGALWDVDPDTSRFVLIKVSFFLGTTHLVLAHLRQALGYAPSSKALSEIGWCLVLLAMLAIVWKLFSLSLPAFAVPDWLVLGAVAVLAFGYVLAVVFAYPEYAPAKRIGVGFASSLLPLIGTFGDTMSYIRLMAVGLASYYIAAAFNGLGAMVASAHPALWALGVPVIVIGHALNIGLALIAIFAHGVRLNMLEFSTNAGVQWAGYPYEPFAKQQIKES